MEKAGNGEGGEKKLTRNPFLKKKKPKRGDR